MITGAASGIGLASAELFLESGWQVCGLDRDPQPEDLQATDWERCDLSDPDSLDTLLSRLKEDRWDSLLLCAGVAGVHKPARVLQINFFSAMDIAEALAPAMPANSSVTLVSSGAGMKWAQNVESLRPVVDNPDRKMALTMAVALCESEAHSYVVSKELLCFYAAYRALEFRKEGRRINALSPGGVETPLVPDFTASMGEEAMDFANGQTQRAARPLEIARVALFLASPESGWINGADLRVDGGLTGGLTSGAVHYADWE